MKWPAVPNNMTEVDWPMLYREDIYQGTLSSIGIDIYSQLKYAFDSNWSSLDYHVDVTSDTFIAVGRIRLFALSVADHNLLKQFYCKMYPNHNQIEVRRRVEVVDNVLYRGECFKVHRNDTVNCNVIQARWLSSNPPLRIDCKEPLSRAGTITDIFISFATINGIERRHVLTKVAWYTLHDQMYAFGNHFRLYHQTYCTSGVYLFMPLQRIVCKSALCVVKHQEIKVNAIIPLLGKWAIC